MFDVNLSILFLHLKNLKYLKINVDTAYINAAFKHALLFTIMLTIYIYNFSFHAKDKDIKHINSIRLKLKYTLRSSSVIY